MTHNPDKHLTGASFGQAAKVQLVILGLIQFPEAHLTGFSLGQPFANGH